MKSPDGELAWTAPLANWNHVSSIWIFPEGFQAEDEKVLVSGDKGSMSMAGALVVEEGAVVTWKEAAR